MSFFKKRKEILEAFRALSKTQQKLVRKKKIKGEFTPEEVLHQLKGLRRYQHKIGSIKYNKPQNYFQTRDLNIDLFFGIFLFLIFVALILFGIFSYTIFIVLISISALSIATYILWKMRYKILRLSKEKYLIQAEHISFFAHILLLLSEEIRPNSKILIDLDLSYQIRSKYKTKTTKNYFILTHRFLIWSFFLIPLVILALISYQNPLLIFFSIIIYVFIFALFPLFSLVIEALWGENPKFKTKIYQIPKLSLKAQLIDGTLLSTSITHLVVKRKAIKKKIKIKNFQLQKSKWKYKIRSVLRLQLSFPRSRYPISEADFQKNFEQANSSKISKMKLKLGEKRKAVFYQYEENKMGQGKEIQHIPALKFDKFLNLMSGGAYARLKKDYGKEKPKPVEKEKRENRPIIGSKNKEITPVEPEKEDLTQISGIGDATQRELNRIGIYNFSQLAKLTLIQMEQLAEVTKFSTSRWEEWKNQAKPQVKLEVDDLRQITGIGKALQERLYKESYYHFRQLAELSEKEINFLSKKIEVSAGKLKNWKERANAFVNINSQEDDLSQIKGIGKVIQARLKEMGIVNFQKLLEIPIYQKEYLKKTLQVKEERIEDWQRQALQFLDGDK